MDDDKGNRAFKGGGEGSPSMMIGFRIGVLLLFCAMGTASGREEPIFLSADTTTGRWEDDKLVRIYKGHVMIRHGDLTIRADRATWVEQTPQRVTLLGGISAEDSLGTLSADRMIYQVDTQKGIVEGHVVGTYRDRDLVADRLTYDWASGKGWAEGQVRFTDRREKGQNIEADQITYDRETQWMTAKGSVRLVSRERRTTVMGGVAEYSDKTDSGSVTEGPVFVREDEDGKGEITIRAERMEIASEGETAIAKGDVRIQRGRFEATCEEVFYSESEERLILYIDPKVFQVTEERAEGGSIRRNELAGDTISVKLEENAVRRVKVVGNAEAVSALSDVGEELRDRETRRSFLKGHTISMALDQERLTEMTVGGHAVSLHDAPLERGEESTRTFATGDTIRLLFDEGSIHQVLIKGGVQGIYYFHKGEREAGG